MRRLEERVHLLTWAAAAQLDAELDRPQILARR
jgi:hypothetical protein